MVKTQKSKTGSRIKKEDSSKWRSLSGYYDETNLLNINILGFEQKLLDLNGQFVFEELGVNYASQQH